MAAVDPQAGTLLHRTASVRSGEVELVYRAFGAPGATPILILHGMSFFSYDWIEVADALATGREVVALDQRGFGESGWSSEHDYSAAAFSGDIVNLLEHLGWHRAILMGHSMGGRNATYCAAENPGRAAALVLVDWSPQVGPAGSRRVRETNAGIPDAFASVDEAMAYFGKDEKGPEGDKVRARFEAILAPADGALKLKKDPYFRDQNRAALEAARNPGLASDRAGLDMWAMLGRVECPILDVRGTESDMFAADTVPRVCEANPGLTLVEIEAGHDVAGDNPAALVGEVETFLQEIKP